MTGRAVLWRLFLTCWLVYSFHVGTNFVREHYLTLSLVERGTIRVDPYLGFLADTDIFETPGRGVHIGGNPGASFVAAVALAPFHPLIRAVNRAVVARRAQDSDPPRYEDPRRIRQVFYRRVWELGRDVEFGLITLVTAVFCMAPLAAWSVVVIFRILKHAGLTDRESLGWSLVYAFATPMFMRAGSLSHNAMAAIAALASYALISGALGARLSNPERAPSRRVALRAPRENHSSSAGEARLLGACRHFSDTLLAPATVRMRDALAGFAAGFTIFVDYSGVWCAGLLGLLFLVRMRGSDGSTLLRRIATFGIAAAAPVLALWVYQQSAFGNPFFPGQYHMGRPEWLPEGYPISGFVGPRAVWLGRLLFDQAFGIFTWSPLLLAAPASVFLAPRLFRREDIFFFFALLCALWVWFGSTYYVELQWNAGLRYLMPVVPFAFLASVEVARRLPKPLVYFVVLLSFVFSWSIAMVREDLATSLRSVFAHGPSLRILTVLSRTGGSYLPGSTVGVASLAAFALLCAGLYGIWSGRLEKEPA